MPLNLKKALELHDLVGEYIPEYQEEEPIIDFIGKIVNNIVEDDPVAYANALCLMTGKNLEEITEFSTTFNLELFIKGLTVNNIFELKKFCREIDYA